MINQDFVRLAHRRSVYVELQRLLLDAYIASENPPKQMIVCEEVPFALKEVSQEALLEVLNHLEELQQGERYQMSQFEFRRKDAVRETPKEKSPSEAKQPVLDAGKKRKSKPPPARKGVAGGEPAEDSGESASRSE